MNLQISNKNKSSKSLEVWPKDQDLDTASWDQAKDFVMYVQHLSEEQ